MTITTTNQKGITTLGGTSGLVDQTDKMHSGLIKALESFGQGRKIIGHAGFEIYDSGSYVGYRLKQPIHFLDLGRHVTYETDLEVSYTSQQRDANYDKYDWVVLVPNHGGNPSLLIVPGTLDGANALVSDITVGCIPVALVKVPAGTDTDDTAGYQTQLYTFNNRRQDLSLGYDDGQSTPYYKNTLTATSAAGGTTFTNTIGDLIFDNTDVNDQIVMRLGTDTSATGFEVRNDSDTAAFKVNGLSATDVVGNLVVTQGSSGGQIALKVDNDDVDKVALGIDAANTTATVLDITANALTTGTAIKNSSTGLTTGAAIDLVSTSTPADGSDSVPHTFKTTQTGTGTHSITGMILNVDKTGATGGGKTNTLSGLHIDVDDSTTNDTNATVTMTGLDIDVNSADDTGTLKNIGLDVAVAGADTNIAALFNGGNVGIGTSTPTEILHLQDSVATSPTILIENTGTNASEPEIVFWRSTGIGADSRDLGHIKFKADDSAGNLHTFASFFADSEDADAGTEDGRFIFSVSKGGTDHVEQLRISGSSGIIFNEGGADINFRVEGDNDQELIVADAGEDKVGIGITPTAAHTAKLSLEGSMMIKERPAATADLATYGQLWVKEDVPNNLYFTNDAGNDIKLTEEVFIVSLSDESTDLATGTSKATFNMPFAMTLTSVKATVNTAPVGSTIIVDINEAGSTILTTKLSIDASELTSSTAASAAVIGGAGPALADDALITFDINQVGSSTAGKGLKVTLYGYRT
jgi:hypothetical protein